MPGVRPVPGSAENPLEWKLYITGPEFYNVNGERRKCPYGGRVFEATVKYPASYPFTHPDVSHTLVVESLREQKLWQQCEAVAVAT